MISSIVTSIRSFLDPGGWLGMKPALDPSATVLSLDYKPSLIWKLRLTVGGVVLAIVATVIHFSQDDDITFVAVGFGLFALLNIVRGLAESRFEISILITDDMAIVKRRTFFGREDWQEPLANYKGVLLRERSTRQGRYNIIELVHDDPGRTLPLFVTREKGAARDTQEAFAQRFDLPALYPDGGQMVARDVGALDRTLGDHASGVVEEVSDFPIGEHRDADALPVDPGPAPSGVIVTRDSDAIHIVVGQGAVGRSFTWLFWLALPFVFGGGVFLLQPYMGILVFGMCSIFVLMMLGLQRLFRGGKEDSETVLGLDATSVWVKYAQGSALSAWIERTVTKLVRAKPLERPTERSMDRGAIEQIRVDQRMTHIRTSSGDRQTAYVWQIIIENDSDRLVFAGRQFDQGKMEWVRDFLRHELARGVQA